MIISKEICDELTDLELVEKSLLDIDFFSCIFQRFEDKFIRYIQRISFVSDEEAQDILQESFIKIWTNLNGFDTSLSLSTWLYRIVHNQTISYWRKKKSHGKDKVLSIEESILPAQEIEFDFLDNSASKNEHLKNAMNQLNIKYRDILILKYYEMMSYVEISDVLKIPEGTVAIRLSRAKKKLQKIYRTMNQNSLL